MRGTALLFAFPEPPFVSQVTDLYHYLVSIGFVAQFRIMGSKATETQQVIEEALHEADQNLPFLILYDGHGAPEGWGHYPFGEILSYKWLATNIASSDLFEVVVINACCHATSLFDAFAKDGITTVSGIAPWDGGGLSYGGGLMRWILRSWPFGECPDSVRQEIHHVEGDDVVEYPSVQRYGEIRDHLFFPENVIRRAHRVHFEKVYEFLPSSQIVVDVL